MKGVEMFAATTLTTPRFSFIPTSLSGVWQIQRKPVTDTRGFFSRFYCAEEFAAAGFSLPLQQINHSSSRQRGTLRGMHFQRPPHGETKVVTCIVGRIFDVAVDLRRGSTTFLQWFGAELSAENQQSLLIPEGFAHGFQALSDDCELIYLHSAAYQPASEGAVNASDPRFAIAWPLNITEMSDRDRSYPLITTEFQGIEL